MFPSDRILQMAFEGLHAEALLAFAALSEEDRSSLLRDPAAPITFAICLYQLHLRRELEQFACSKQIKERLAESAKVEILALLSRNRLREANDGLTLALRTSPEIQDDTWFLAEVAMRLILQPMAYEMDGEFGEFARSISKWKGPEMFEAMDRVLVSRNPCMIALCAKILTRGHCFQQSMDLCDRGSEAFPFHGELQDQRFQAHVACDHNPADLWDEATSQRIAVNSWVFRLRYQPFLLMVGRGRRFYRLRRAVARMKPKLRAAANTLVATANK